MYKRRQLQAVLLKSWIALIWTQLERTQILVSFKDLSQSDKIVTYNPYLWGWEGNFPGWAVS
jgi:hypothetical protein